MGMLAQGAPAATASRRRVDLQNGRACSAGVSSEASQSTDCSMSTPPGLVRPTTNLGTDIAGPAGNEISGRGRFPGIYVTGLVAILGRVTPLGHSCGPEL